MPATRPCVDEFEARFVKPAKGRVLIVGSRIYDDKPDRRKLHKDALGVDMQDGPGVDLVCNLENRLPAGLGKFAHVECMSVLEHSKRPWLLAKNIESLLPKEGTLFLTVPFVWRVHDYPGDYWRFTMEGVQSLFVKIRWERLMFAHTKLTRKALVPVMSDKTEYPYMARTEVCGWGVKE